MRLPSSALHPDPLRPSYRIRRTSEPLDRADGGPTTAPSDPSHPPSGAAGEVLQIASFHPRSSDHRPRTAVRVAYDDQGIHLRFDVDDRWVRCVETEPQSRVSRDSCVEFFVQPKPDRGYFNFEANCGGTLLVFYIEDATRIPGKLFKHFTILPPEHVHMVQITSSLPKTVLPEIESPVHWHLSMHIPFSLFETYVGPIGPITGQRWRGNFFKCGDQTSHPHWASWAPIGETLSFHQPSKFAPLIFDDDAATTTER